MKVKSAVEEERVSEENSCGMRTLRNCRHKMITQAQKSPTLKALRHEQTDMAWHGNEESKS